MGGLTTRLAVYAQSQRLAVDGMNLVVVQCEVTDKKGVVKNNLQLSRTVPYEVPGGGNPSAPKLCFWGRVIDGVAAATASRLALLPLEPKNAETFPRLFVDGSSVMNMERSDYCAAWSIKPLPIPKEKPAPENENDDVASGPVFNNIILIVLLFVVC